MRGESGIVAQGGEPRPLLVQREKRTLDGAHRLGRRLERRQLREVRDPKALDLHRPRISEGRGHDVGVYRHPARR